MRPLQEEYREVRVKTQNRDRYTKKKQIRHRKRTGLHSQTHQLSYLPSAIEAASAFHEKNTEENVFILFCFFFLFENVCSISHSLSPCPPQQGIRITLGLWVLVSCHMVTGMQILRNLVCPLVRTGTGV